jgi:hypothetical protein
MLEIGEELNPAGTNLRTFAVLSHWRNDEMHSWFKTCDGLASSLRVRLIHSSVALTLTIILLGVPAHPQFIPSSQVLADDLARRVVTNELNFQDDHTNWMYRLEKEQYGKKQVEEIVETKEGSLSRLLLYKRPAPYRETTAGRGPAGAGVNDQSKCATKITASSGR